MTDLPLGVYDSTADAPWNEREPPAQEPNLREIAADQGWFMAQECGECEGSGLYGNGLLGNCPRCGGLGAVEYEQHEYLDDLAADYADMQRS